MFKKKCPYSLNIIYTLTVTINFWHRFKISWRFLHSRAYLVAFNLFICKLLWPVRLHRFAMFETASNGNKLICFGLSLFRGLGGLRTFRSALVFVYIMCLLRIVQRHGCSMPKKTNSYNQFAFESQAVRMYIDSIPDFTSSTQRNH